jgi:hypothetical protein
VTVLTTIALDLVLAFTLLFSVQIAAGWGELCGIRPGRDKSGLGGFVAIYLFLLLRWLVLAGCIAGFATPDERWWLLGGHAVLGIASVRLFGQGLERVQKDRTVPDLLGVAGSTLLPVPAWTFVVHRVNVAWLGDSGVAIATVAAALGGLHLVLYRQRRTGMLAVRA